MSTFEQDWAEAERVANQKKVSATRKTQPMPDLPMRTVVRPVKLMGEMCISPRPENFNHLKKVNRPAQPVSYRKSVIRRLLGLQ